MADKHMLSEIDFDDDDDDTPGDDTQPEQVHICMCAGCRMAYAVNIDVGNVNNMANMSLAHWQSLWPFIHACILFLGTGAADAEDEKTSVEIVMSLHRELDAVFKAARKIGRDKNEAPAVTQQRVIEELRTNASEYTAKCQA